MRNLLSSRASAALAVWLSCLVPPTTLVVGQSVSLEPKGCNGYDVLSVDFATAKSKFVEPQCYTFSFTFIAGSILGTPPTPETRVVNNGVALQAPDTSIYRTLADFYNLIDTNCISACADGTGAGAYECRANFTTDATSGVTYPSYLLINPKSMMRGDEMEFTIQNVTKVDCSAGNTAGTPAPTRPPTLAPIASPAIPPTTNTTTNTTNNTTGGGGNGNGNSNSTNSTSGGGNGSGAGNSTNNTTGGGNGNNGAGNSTNSTSGGGRNNTNSTSGGGGISSVPNRDTTNNATLGPKCVGYESVEANFSAAWALWTKWINSASSNGNNGNNGNNTKPTNNTTNTTKPKPNTNTTSNATTTTTNTTTNVTNPTTNATNATNATGILGTIINGTNTSGILDTILNSTNASGIINTLTNATNGTSPTGILDTITNAINSTDTGSGIINTVNDATQTGSGIIDTISNPFKLRARYLQGQSSNSSSSNKEPCYTFVIKRGGNVLPDRMGPFNITVANNTVVNTNGSDLNRTLTEYMNYIRDTCFKGCPNGTNESAYKCDIQYAPEGYPSYIVIDHDSMLADEEEYYYISNVTTVSCDSVNSNIVSPTRNIKSSSSRHSSSMVTTFLMLIVVPLAVLLYR